MTDLEAAVSAAPFDLAVGTLVVYGEHGIGRVCRRGAGPADDGLAESVVVEFEGGLSVTFPLERAAGCLRPVAGVRDVVRARQVLRSTEPSLENTWQARTRSNQQKVASGGTIGLAEVVRDTARRQRSSSSGATMSSRERELYLKARRLLAAELGAATGTGEAESEAWIDAQLRFEAARR